MTVLRWISDNPALAVILLLVTFGGIGEIIRALRRAPKAADDD